jgi:hypothetical protein
MRRKAGIKDGLYSYNTVMKAGGEVAHFDFNGYDLADGIKNVTNGFMGRNRPIREEVKEAIHQTMMAQVAMELKTELQSNTQIKSSISLMIKDILNEEMSTPPNKPYDDPEKRAARKEAQERYDTRPFYKKWFNA